MDAAEISAADLTCFSRSAMQAAASVTRVEDTIGIGIGFGRVYYEGRNWFTTYETRLNGRAYE